MNEGLLLDTCALIWLGNGAALRLEARQAIRDALGQHLLLVSAVSGWELGAAHLRQKNPLRLLPDVETWMGEFLGRPGVRMLPLEIAPALQAFLLPEPFHKDPADRLLVAQARVLDVPIVTRDRRILAYADQGHVQAIAC